MKSQLETKSGTQFETQLGTKSHACTEVITLSLGQVWACTTGGRSALASLKSGRVWLTRTGQWEDEFYAEGHNIKLGCGSVMEALTASATIEVTWIHHEKIDPGSRVSERGKVPAADKKAS